MIWLLSLLWAQPQEQDMALFNEQWHVVHINPKEVDILLLGRSHELRSADKVWQWAKAQKKEPLFVMNAGMFHKDHTPVGLFMDPQGLWVPLNKDEGDGNFFLKPNGVFGLDRNGVPFIVDAEEVLPQYIKLATQSGPLLVKGGVIHPVFKIDSKHQKIRNGVGVTGDGNIVWVISLTPVRFYDFAKMFIHLGCDQALYLDGTVSTLKTQKNSFGKTKAKLGPILLAVPKREN